MKQIQQITDYPLQKQTISLPDGTTFQITLYFVTRQQGWFVKELSYGSFVLNNIRVVCTPNMLHQFKNQLPFGIACFTDDNREPMLQQDFSSGSAKLFLLTKAEVEFYEDYLSGS
jgi:hypothetical protein